MKNNNAYAAQARHLVVMCLTLAAATAIGCGFNAFGFDDASIISLYILATLVVAVGTTGRALTLLSSALSVVLYNFFFVVPVFSLDALDKSYLVTFLIMFIAALVASELTGAISRSAREAARAARRTQTLLETNQLLQRVHGEEGIAAVAMGQLARLFGRDVVFVPARNSQLDHALAVTAAGAPSSTPDLAPADRAAAAAVLVAHVPRPATPDSAAPSPDPDAHAAHTQDADPGSSAAPPARFRFAPVEADGTVFGALGIASAPKPLDEGERSMAVAIAGACALALERDREARERQEAAIMARNEQLRANLLRSIGHDLRTPLTAISGSAAILRDENGRLAAPQRAALADAIYEDALWLSDMVENLLTVTRIEDGSIELTLTSELVQDVLEAAVAHVARHTTNHPIEIEPQDDFLFAKMDANLVVQLLVNLIGNAVKYTPAGTPISLSARREGAFVRIAVADTGPGVADADKPRIFERFYTGTSAQTPADARRSVGLGLALCRSIAEAHGGTIEVHDNRPHGAVFSFTLPAEEVEIHE